MRARWVILLVLSSPPALAWEVFFRVSSEITFRGLSESSTTSSHESRDAEREEQETAARQRAATPGLPQPAGAACKLDADCNGWCREGTCTDQERPAPAIPPCTTDAQCAPGYACIEGTCIVPPTSVRRESLERLLRDRPEQLREDLALGAGPVLRQLATWEGQPPETFGRLLRARRAELLPLVGADDRWASTFVRRVDVLADELTRASAAVCRAP